MDNKKKRIGCVLAYCDNYGTMLQSYATIKTIENLGYICEIIRYTKKENLLMKMKRVYWMFRIGDASDQIRQLKRKINLTIHPEYKKNKTIKHLAFARFGNKLITPYFREVTGYENLKKAAFDYDLVLVGSDQLWTPMSLYGSYYNLMFVDDRIPKVAYAASFGVNSIPPFQREATKRFLDRFDMIGVRESRGKEIVDELSINKATHVADPSLLITREQWQEVCQSSNLKMTEPFILCLFLGKNKESREAVKKLKDKTNLKIVAIIHNDEYFAYDNTFGDETPYDVSPYDFVKLIEQATYVCTDSFHCTIFSILFHKKFMTFYRFANTKKGGRNSRIDSLLDKTELRGRIYNGNVMTINEEIDYNSVDKIIDEFRCESTDYLKKELELANRL